MWQDGERSSSRSNRLSAIARAASSRRYDMTGETGSYRYMAPEVFRHEPYNSKVDVRLPAPAPPNHLYAHTDRFVGKIPFNN